ARSGDAVPHDRGTSISARMSDSSRSQNRAGIPARSATAEQIAIELYRSGSGSALDRPGYWRLRSETEDPDRARVEPEYSTPTALRHRRSNWLRRQARLAAATRL